MYVFYGGCYPIENMGLFCFDASVEDESKDEIERKMTTCLVFSSVQKVMSREKEMCTEIGW